MEQNTGTETNEGLILGCGINACSCVRNGVIVQRQESSSLENTMVGSCNKVEKALNSCGLIIHGSNYQCMKGSNGMLSLECRKHEGTQKA